jgi:enoyl-CoA hydratase/carnithine racemase
MQWENVTYEVDNHIATITMSRPETLNTLTAAMIRDIDEAMKTADRDPGVRVIIFTGAGRAFSSGHDLSGRPREIPPGSPRPGSVEFRFDFEEEYYLEANLTIRNLRKPTIAGLRGHVVLGGLMTALMCDLVIAEESTNLWNPSLRHAGTGGEVMVLPWDIGVRKTKLHLWTGDALDVYEAERLGMVSRVVKDGTLDAECRRLADRIALMPPRVLQMTKRSLNKMQEIQGQLLAYEHHFLMHQLGHASDEAAEWNAEAAKHREQGGFKAWLQFRDGPFQEQATREYVPASGD